MKRKLARFICEVKALSVSPLLAGIGLLGISYIVLVLWLI
jgi:hypothetical protein